MEREKFKLLVIGYARHGKDTVCEILRDHYGYSFESSSYYCAEHVVIPYLKELGITYATIDECYEDRVNHRDKWFNSIKQYAETDPTGMSRGILEHSDIYCGMRGRPELEAAKEAGLFDLILWVDASNRLPPEDSSSNMLTADDADFVLDNNGDLEGLLLNVRFLMGRIGDYVESAKTRLYAVD